MLEKDDFYCALNFIYDKNSGENSYQLDSPTIQRTFYAKYYALLQDIPFDGDYSLCLVRHFFSHNMYDIFSSSIDISTNCFYSDAFTDPDVVDLVQNTHKSASKNKPLFKPEYLAENFIGTEKDTRNNFLDEIEKTYGKRDYPRIALGFLAFYYDRKKFTDFFGL